MVFFSIRFAKERQQTEAKTKKYTTRRLVVREKKQNE